MLEKLFKKQIYTIGYDVIFNNRQSNMCVKVLADNYEDAKKIIKDDYVEDAKVVFSDYNPFNIEKVSDYINETTIKSLLLERDIITEE